jgi:hypothetical protein
LFIHYHHPSVHPSIHSIHHHPSVHPSIHHRPFPLAMQTPTTTPYGRGVRALPLLLLWSVCFFRELSTVARLTPPPSFPFVPLSLSLSLSLHLLLFLSLASWHYTNFVTFFTFDSSFLSY